MPSTQNTTGNNQSSLQFNPTAQGVYNNLVGGAGGVLSGYLNNPFGNPAYTLGAAQSQQGAQQAGSNNMQSLLQNQLTSGLTGKAGAGFAAAQGAQTGRANQALSSQANIQNVMQALQRQMSAAGTGLSFSPQLTGQSGSFNQQSGMSGLGTWLPQIASMLGGGALGGLGAATSGAASGATAATSPFTSANLSQPNAGFVNSLNNPFQQSGMGSGGLAGMLGSGGSSAPSPLFNSLQPQAAFSGGGWG